MDFTSEISTHWPADCTFARVAISPSLGVRSLDETAAVLELNSVVALALLRRAHSEFSCWARQPCGGRILLGRTRLHRGRLSLRLRESRDYGDCPDN